MDDNPDMGTGLDLAQAAAAIAAIGTGDNDDNPSADVADDTTADVSHVEAEAQQADDESTTPEDDAETDEVDAEESEEESDADADEPLPVDAPEILNAKITVKVGDKVQTITVEEARKGVMFQADYSRKSEAVAEERRALQAKDQELSAEREKLARLIPELERQLDEAPPTEPDWHLWNTNPGEAARQQHIFDTYKATKEATKVEKEKLAAEKARQQQEYSQALQAQEWTKVLAAKPEWRDDKAWARDSQAIFRYAKEVGYTPDDLNAADHDSRIVLTLWEAAQYRALTKNKPKPAVQRSDAPRPVAPSSKAGARPVSDRTRAEQRLARTGSLHDAAALMAQIRGDKRK
jgi:hypothetical protein